MPNKFNVYGNLFLLLMMSALKCYKVYATICLEIYNDSFGTWAAVLRVIYLVKLDRPETIRDWAKMNLASHHI